VAPGAIIVEEAGGRVTDFAGRTVPYEGSIAASNGRIHAALVAALQER
jgi:fructose-1,6-bisphosphatase/inositol monophosphatase family enzyme